MTKKQIKEMLVACGSAVKGSLVEVRKPCIRANCTACKSGRKHLAFMFHYAKGGKRCCMYVPLACVEPLRQALDNGRLVEECLHEAGPVLIKAWRAKTAKSA
ncbi:MAG: DUF6788 family protein [bacterium]